MLGRYNRANLEGHRFGRLLVIEWCKEKQGWLCICDCGNYVYQNTSHLKTSVLSCGCLNKETQVLNGYSGSREYNSFRMMHARCDPNNQQKEKYSNYVDRGITVHEEWELTPKGFSKFLEDMGIRPENGTLERIDVNGNYCKENCTWATPEQQCYNRRLFKNNKTGVTGVSWDKYKGKWVATISRGEIRWRKCFDNIDDAISARKLKEKELYPEYEEVRNGC